MSEPIDTTTLLAVNKAANDWLEETRQGQKKAMPNYSPIPDEPVQMSLIMVEAVIRALNVTKTHTLSQGKWAATSSELLVALEEMTQMVEYLAPEKFDNAEHEREFNARLEHARLVIQKARSAA